MAQSFALFVFQAITHDGEEVWVASMGSTSVDRLDGTGDLTGSFKVAEWPADRTDAWGGGGTAIAFGGEFIWVTVASTNFAVKLDTDGNLIGRYPVGRWPTAVLIASGNVWVTNFLDNSVSCLSRDGTAH